MKPRSSLRHFLLAAGSSLLAISSATAADLFWDGNGSSSNTGGAGVWNDANRWRTVSLTGTLGNWSNGNNAVFAGTAAGTVTLSSSVIVSRLTFNATDNASTYTIGATTDTTNTISFNGGTYSSSNPNIAGTALSSTISAKLTGTVTGGFFINAAAATGTSTQRVSLRNTSNDFTGNIHVISSNLAIESDNGVYGNAANKVILNAGDNGGLSIATGQDTTRTFSRDIEIGASNAKLTTLASSPTSANLVVDFTGAITGAGTWNRVGTLGGVGTSNMHLAGDMSGFTGTYVNVSGGDTTVRTTAGSGGHWRVDTGTLAFGTGTFATTNNLTVNTGGILSMGSNSLSFGNLTGTGGTINGTSGTRTLTIGAGNATGGNFQGTIANGTGGTTAVTKTGTGTLTLSGINTYTGGTQIDNGILTLGHATNTLVNTGAVNVNGGTLALGTNTDTVGAVTLTSGSITGSGAGALTGTSYAVESGSVSAILAGSGVMLTKSTAGTVTLTNANSYTGTTIVNGGVLALSASGSLDAASNIQVDSGTLSIAEGGAGRTFANTIVLNGGTVQSLQDNTGTGGTITHSGGNVTHTFTASGTLTLSTAVTSDQLIVGGGGGGGAGVNGVVYAAGGGGGKVSNLTGQALAAGNTTVTVGAGGTAGFNGNGGTGGTSSIGSNTAVGGSGATGTVGTGGASGFPRAGGTSNSFSAGGGGGDSAVGSNAPSTNTGGAGGAGTVGTITGLTYGGGGGGSASTTGGAGGDGGGGNGGNNSFGSVGAANTGGGGGGGAAGGSGIAIVQYAYATLGGGAVTLNGTIDLQSASTLDAYGSGGLLSVDGLISTSAGAGGLTIASSNSSGGVVRFGSANTYVGDTTVNTGATLRMNTTNALPNGSGKGNLSLSGTLDLNGQATTSLNGLSGTGTIDNNTGAGTYTLSVGNNNQTSSFGGVIQNTSGTIVVTKTGIGTLTLSNTNTYTGATNVNAGTLIVNGSLASTSVVVDGALGGSGLMVGATLSGTGSINPGNSPGIMTAAATNPSGGLDYNFELTGAANSLPVWSNAAASVNDVLRLTDATNPFTASLNNTNTITIYLGVTTLTLGDAFTGGFFTDKNADFLASVQNATFQYFLSDPLGLTTYLGNNYTLYSGPLDFLVSTVQIGSADFDGGTVTNGYVTQFTVIPEPKAALLGGLGLLALLRRRR